VCVSSYPPDFKQHMVDVCARLRQELPDKWDNDSARMMTHVLRNIDSASASAYTGADVTTTSVDTGSASEEHSDITTTQGSRYELDSELSNVSL
jgi:hypothetical protein